MRNQVFFAGIPDNELPDHSRSIIEQEFRGQEVKFVKETNPKEFVKNYSYRDESTGRASVAGYSVRVIGNVREEDSALWNKLSGNPKSGIQVIFAEDAELEKITDTQIAEWAKTGKVPADEQADDDFSFLFSEDDEADDGLGDLIADDPKPAEKQDEADALIEEHDTPVDTSALASNPLARPSAPAVMPMDIQREMDSVRAPKEEEAPREPVNRINSQPMNNASVQVNDSSQVEPRTHNNGGPVLPPFMAQETPSGPPEDPRRFDSFDEHLTEQPTQSHAAAPQHQEPVYREEPRNEQPQQSPQSFDRYDRQPQQMDHVQQNDQYDQNRFDQNSSQGYAQPQHNQQSGYQHNQQSGYQNMHPDQERARQQFVNPIHQREEEYAQPQQFGGQQNFGGGFNQPNQPTYQDTDNLNDEILGGPAWNGQQNDNYRRGSGASGFPNLDHDREYGAPYMQRLEPEQQQRQVGAVSRFEQTNGIVSPVSQHNAPLPKNKVLMVTSTRGGGGKTSLSYILANSLSMGLSRTNPRDNRLVWLLEADYENPKLEDRFKSRNNNISVIARALMDSQGGSSGGGRFRRTDSEVIASVIDQASILPADAPDNLRVIPAHYDFSGSGGGVDPIPAKWITYAITATIKFIRDHLGGYIVIDNGTLTGEQFNPLHQALVNLSTKTVVVAWPDNVEDALRAANIVTQTGTPVANTKIFLNKVDSNDEFYLVQEKMKPYETAGFWPTMPAIDKKWIGGPQVSDEDRTALLVRGLAFLRQIGFQYETDNVIQAFEHVNDAQPHKGIRGKLRGLTKIFSK